MPFALKAYGILSPFSTHHAFRPSSSRLEMLHSPRSQRFITSDPNTGTPRLRILHSKYHRSPLSFQVLEVRKRLRVLCDLVALMIRIRDGRLNGALAITLMYRVMLTPGFPPRRTLHSLQGFLQGREIHCTTNHLHLPLRLDMTMHSLIHPVAIALRTRASAGSDDFYDFYVVHSDSVLDLDIGCLDFMANSFGKSFQFISSTCLTRSCIGHRQ